MGITITKIMENLKEFKKLIKRYESITLGEIQETQNKYNEDIWDISDLASLITGINDHDTCTLCKPVLNGDRPMQSSCNGCVYTVKTNYKCYNGMNENTFEGITERCNTHIGLLRAFRKRAKHMKTLLT